MKKITLLAIGFGFLMSCSTSNDVVKNGWIQKRKYNKGWYVNKSQNIAKKSGKSKNEVAVSTLKVQEEKTTTAKKTITYAEAKEDKTVVASSSNVLTPKTITKQPVKKQNKVVEKQTKVKEDILVYANNELASKIITKEPAKISKAQKKSGDTSASGHPMILLYILAILIPPVAVGLVTDWETNPVIYSLLWTLLCGLPGIIHAFIIIGRYR